MASDMFLDLGIAIKGESKDSVYAGKIDILNWGWRVSQTGSFHTGGGGGAGKVKVENLFIAKLLDTASPNFMRCCAKGTHLAEGKLVVRKAGGEQLEYLIVKMEEVLVAKYSTSSLVGVEIPVEHVELNFARVNVEYVPQKADGSGDAGISFGWNIAEHCEA